MTPIGVLALQGDFDAHVGALRRAGAACRPVRRASEIRESSGLVLPGGESTTLITLLRELDLVEPLLALHRGGVPLLGTCAGAILLAAAVENPGQFSLGLIDIGIERNAYGRQRDSFEAAGGETSLAPDGAEASGGDSMPMVFIRAPRIVRLGAGVRVLGRLGEEPVLVEQGAVMAATFHPELTGDLRVHRRLAARAFRAVAAV